MGKIPPKGRKGTASSTRRIADKLGIPLGKGRPVKPATAGPVPPAPDLRVMLAERKPKEPHNAD